MALPFSSIIFAPSVLTKETVFSSSLHAKSVSADTSRVKIKIVATIVRFFIIFSDFYIVSIISIFVCTFNSNRRKNFFGGTKKSNFLLGVRHNLDFRGGGVFIRA